jgi:hypothetical protein
MEDLRTFLGFRSFDASNLSVLMKMKEVQQEEAKRQGKEFKEGDMKILSLVNEENMTTIHPTFQKHFKFAIKEAVAPKDEKKTYSVLIACLISFCNIPREFFEGGGMVPKCGLTVFPDTPYEASIRLWCSKQVGKNVIYELTVSSYKDAVPEPMEEKPSQWKKVVLKDEK